MEKVNIDGINIAYVRRGRGIPLVLIHGYPLDHSIWDGVVPILSQDFDLILPDLRGFGASDVMEADHSILDYASDIAGLLNQLKIKRVVLAGHSMGGYVALAFAREFPERLSGLALISSQLRADTAEGKKGRYALAKQVREEGIGVVLQTMPSKLSAEIRIQDFARDLISRQRPSGLISALHAMADRPDSEKIFAAFNLPVVIVHGDGDAMIPVERAREMKTAIASAHYVELAGLGHMPMMENPPAVSAALKFFVILKGKTVK